MKKISLFHKESKLLITGFFLLVFLIIVVAWSISHLVFQLDTALKILPVDDENGVIHFELEKFEALDLIK